MYIFGWIILIFFAIVGLSVFIGTVIKANLKSDTDGFVLVVPYVDENNAEARIRSAAAMTEGAHGCRVICICRENDPARIICEKMKQEFPQLKITDEYEIM